MLNLTAGYYYWEALELLQAAGILSPPQYFQYGIEYPITLEMAKSTEPPGWVLTQSVAAGITVKLNVPIILTVSEFPMNLVFP